MIDADGTDTRVRAALDRVIDEATRAGVVIYSLDARGLQSGSLQAADNLKRPTPGQTMEATVREKSAARHEFNRGTQEALAYIAEQTGGFAVLNTNDLGRGLGRIAADVRDYYVVGYLPEGGTFAGEGKKPSRHKIAISVRRPGLRVKTRKDFLGVSDPDDSPGTLTPAQTLVHTAISPFATSDIALAATTLPGYSPDRGLFVRTLLYIDARALTFVEDAIGKKTAAGRCARHGVRPRRDRGRAPEHGVLRRPRRTVHGGRASDRIGLHTARPHSQGGAYQLRFAVRGSAIRAAR